MKVYIVSTFDTDEPKISLDVFDTYDKAVDKQKELAEELYQTTKLKHDKAQVEFQHGGAYIWNGEFYEFEIEIYEEEVK